MVKARDDAATPSSEESIFRREVTGQVQIALKQMPLRQRLVLTKRYGLDGERLERLHQLQQ